MQVHRSDDAYHFYTMTTSNLFEQSYPRMPLPILRHSLHGKEIRTVALHQLDDQHGTILAATGSEDNSLKISIVDQQTLDFRTVFRLRDPTIEGAGTVGALSWSRSSCSPESALLFVSAAQGALYALSISLTDVGGIRVQRFPSALAVNTGQSSMEDCRVTAMDVAAIGGDQHDFSHLLVAGYSDGSVKVPAMQSLPTFRFRPSAI